MNTNGYRFFTTKFVIICFFLWFNPSACAPTTTPTPFIPPLAPSPTGAVILAPPVSDEALPQTSPTPELDCTDNLLYLDDLTVPDGSFLTPGAQVDKQWRVENNGTCNWDSDYRLKLVSGEALGAANEQALYPARAGTQVTLRILFTAPLEPGTYSSSWQAFNPDGEVFGDYVIMEIVVGG